ncbi:PREDICTED: uncharacterized protein LOC106787210 isoform X1 [Polistes canadensis]|uniref:uncharacterized protein LOC106787210 isoform X1 n=1 Tax=Polistes canadensis TaxID=91411 RepID=UPI000718D2FB|nr:PREDICTED: uncharacterized protein LOC106787210 isoform X1 [Polistes canadensis]
MYPLLYETVLDQSNSLAFTKSMRMKMVWLLNGITSWIKFINGSHRVNKPLDYYKNSYLPPQDMGIITNYSKYPAKNLIEPETRSIIDLKMITLDMSGEYMCVIKTFSTEHTKATRMIVYVPESSAKIHVTRFNDSHTNIKCTVLGAQPRPTLKLYIEGIKIDDKFDQSSLIIHDNIYKYNSYVIWNSIIKNMINPVLIECEISISETNYKRREKMVYYPDGIKLG